MTSLPAPALAALSTTATGQFSGLYAYDEKQNPNLVNTLRTWLHAFGDFTSAFYIHPNTFRNSLRRLAIVGVLDLDDPKTGLPPYFSSASWPPAPRDLVMRKRSAVIQHTAPH
ncbi:hypothetical protein [Arthrobacter sp. 18067]|uniref:PucR family transcriptional regulator n=1 Tax=Arthrobacter sp. 18067 TaxID=2681413 RepID=UPI00135A7BED|nr:hypothetical protein [Arthrobacter sp. 18067]